MGDWNNDGKVDLMDYHIYTHYIDKGCSGGRRKSSSCNGFMIVLAIAIIVSVFNELIGAAILFGYIYYELILK